MNGDSYLVLTTTCMFCLPIMILCIVYSQYEEIDCQTKYIELDTWDTYILYTTNHKMKLMDYSYNGTCYYRHDHLTTQNPFHNNKMLIIILSVLSVIGILCMPLYCCAIYTPNPESEKRRNNYILKRSVLQKGPLPIYDV